MIKITIWSGFAVVGMAAVVALALFDASNDVSYRQAELRSYLRWGAAGILAGGALNAVLYFMLAEIMERMSGAEERLAGKLEHLQRAVDDLRGAPPTQAEAQRKSWI